MSFKKAVAVQLQNLMDQVKNLDKAIIEESKKLGNDLVENIDTKIEEQLPYELPINFSFGEVVDEQLLSKTGVETYSDIPFPNEFDTSEYLASGDKTDIPPEPKDGNLLIIYNGDNSDFDVTKFGTNPQTHPLNTVDEEVFYKNRFVLIWGTGSLTRKQIRNYIINTKYYYTKNWVICDFKVGDTNVFSYYDVLKKLQKYRPESWIISAIGIGNGCAPALEVLGPDPGPTLPKNYTGYYNEPSNAEKRKKGNLYYTTEGGIKYPVLPLVGFIFPTFPQNSTWTSVNTSTFIPTDSKKTNLLVYSNNTLGTVQNKQQFNRVYSIYSNSSITPSNSSEYSIPTTSTGGQYGSNISNAVLARQSWIESNWKNTAGSHAGAVGVGQITLIAAQEYKNKTGIDITSKTARQSISKSYDFMVWQMNYHITKTSFIANPNTGGRDHPFIVKLAKALGTYNKGVSFVNTLNKIKSETPGGDIYTNLDWVEKVPIQETRVYIQSILNLPPKITVATTIDPDPNSPTYGQKTIAATRAAVLKRYEDYEKALKRIAPNNKSTTKYDSVLKVFFEDNGEIPTYYPFPSTNTNPIPEPEPELQPELSSEDKDLQIQLPIQFSNYFDNFVSFPKCVQNVNDNWSDGSMIVNYFNQYGQYF